MNGRTHRYGSRRFRFDDLVDLLKQRDHCLPQTLVFAESVNFYAVYCFGNEDVTDRLDDQIDSIVVGSQPEDVFIVLKSQFFDAHLRLLSLITAQLKPEYGDTVEPHETTENPTNIRSMDLLRRPKDSIR
uniref:Uncharacterized protein n=1 Tax=Rhodopseudomonas palustris (strain BisA53) TaxID=316055 RepID=Q07U61_RHOP5